MKSKRLYTALLFFALTVQLFSLGAFNMFNGRNRPELKWKEISTPQIKIVYHDDLYPIALEAMAIADSTYQTLVKTFDIKPDKQIIIYISDQDNIANGATVLDFYIFVWVNQNDFTKSFTGDHKWLRKVLAHEIVHWFVFYGLKDWLSFSLISTSVGFPGEMHEGYAQFFSGEVWGFNRGDRYMRSYVLAEDDGERSGRWSGGYMYASGFAFVKYLSEFYGEEKLVQLLKYRNKNSKLYSFDKAFEETYKKSFKDIQKEWELYIKTYYFGEAYTQKATHKDPYSKDLTVNAITKLETQFSINDFLIKDDKIMANVKLNKKQGYQNLILGQLDPDSLKADKFHFKDYKVITNQPHFVDFDFSTNGKYAVYTRYTRHKYGRYAPLVTLRDIINKKDYHIGEGSYPVVTNEGVVYYQKNSMTENAIYTAFPLYGGGQGGAIEEKAFLSLRPENQIGELALNNNDTYLAVSLFDQDRQFYVTIFETSPSETTGARHISTTETTPYPFHRGEIYAAIELPAMAQDLLWKDNQTLVIIVENSDNFKLETYLFDIETQTLQLYETPPYNIFPRYFYAPPALSGGSRGGTPDTLTAITWNENYRGAMVLGKVKLVRSEELSSVTSSNSTLLTPNLINYYSRWLSATPTHQIADEIPPATDFPIKTYNPLTNIRFRQGLALPFETNAFGMAVFSEPLGKHIFQVFGIVPYDTKEEEPQYIAMYINNSFKPSIFLTAMQIKWIAGIVTTSDEHSDDPRDKDIIWNHLKRYSLSAELPINIKYSRFTRASISGGISHLNFTLADESRKHNYIYNANGEVVDNLFDEGDMVIANIGAEYIYNLPWLNSRYHPMRRFALSGSVDYGENLDTEQKYQQYTINSDIAYAPFLWNVTLHNRSSYRIVPTDDPMHQFLPGVDKNENILMDSGRPMFSRMYLRGFKNEPMWGKELLTTQTDLRLRIADFNASKDPFSIAILSPTYLGASLWYDYSKLKQGYYLTEDISEARNINFEAMGYEILGGLNILGIQTLHRFGRAYKPNWKKYGDTQYETYYMMEIGFYEF